MDASCKRHNRSLQSPRLGRLVGVGLTQNKLQSLSATVPTPPPAFKTGPTARFLERVSFLPPPFCSSLFCETGSLPLTYDRISVLWPSAPNGNPNRMKIQTFRPHCTNTHWILALAAGFGTRGSKW
ncbi:hypothetical protein AVEN_33160-1 [Araneus ventricosus]|uniref:Uncharacterized protein n=1 Tax=Araneus ventricosus TaxID=182803 RepID=A0A4Y2TTP6_ARAVE|nr:hypothetical protein AVEN_33160-1 [Araneus ventricosus]